LSGAGVGALGRSWWACGHDHHPVGVGETISTLVIGISSKAAATATTLAPPVRVTPDQVTRRDRLRESAHRFPTRIVNRAYHQQPQSPSAVPQPRIVCRAEFSPAPVANAVMNLVSLHLAV
jgi:hypothetical protein